MQINDVKTTVFARANSSRLLLGYLGAFAVCITFVTILQRQAIQAASLRQSDAAPPQNIQRRAEQITQTLFPDAAPAVLVWSAMDIRRRAEDVLWAADIHLGGSPEGRLTFDATGRLRQFSSQIMLRGPAILCREDALSIARTKIRCLQKSDWYYCHLGEERLLRQPGQVGGSWYIRGQKSGMRILLTLDARTGALIFFLETTPRPSKAEPSNVTKGKPQ